ncbi:MAG TPA: peptidylprolyl isomerase [Polyangiaceae bacterium]|nr:peptidylprolyl isomerase [Polyangiaceae bacterium]
MGRLASLLREPLVHFALVGALVFGADRLRSAPAPVAATPRVIRLGAEMRRELAENFQHRQGREPSPEELTRARERWLEDEVLYREGVALGLASDDVLIKNRVVEKMRFVLSNAAPPREPREQELRAFWQERRADYERAKRYDFEHVTVPGSTSDEQRESAARLERQLSGGLAPESLGPLHRLFEGRSAENVTAMFGASVEARLATSALQTWQVVEGDASRPSPSQEVAQPASAGGTPARELHLFRVLAVENATPPDFDALREELSADWRRHERQLGTQQRLKEMRDRYSLEEGGS